MASITTKKTKPPVKVSKQEFDDWIALSQKREPLRPELRKYLESHGSYTMIRHPLCVMSCDPDRAGLVHMIFDARREVIAKASKARNWDVVLWYYEDPFKLQAFIDYCHPIKDADYWRLLLDIWNSQITVWQKRGVYLNLFLSPRRKRPHLTLEEDRMDFERLPASIPVYRGFQGRGSKGMSWTLDRRRAVWFAKRFKDVFPEKQPKIATGFVQKNSVLAYYRQDDIRDVVVHPQAVRSVSVIATP